MLWALVLIPFVTFFPFFLCNFLHFPLSYYKWIKKEGGGKCNLIAHYLPMKFYLNDSRWQGNLEHLQELGSKSEKQDKTTFSNEN